MLVRTDAAGATHALTARIAELGMEFSIGAYLHHFDIHAILRMIPKHAWTPAYNADGKPRDGAWWPRSPWTAPGLLEAVGSGKDEPHGSDEEVPG